MDSEHKSIVLFLMLALFILVLCPNIAAEEKAQPQDTVAELLDAILETDRSQIGSLLSNRVRTGYGAILVEKLASHHDVIRLSDAAKTNEVMKQFVLRAEVSTRTIGPDLAAVTVLNKYYFPELTFVLHLEDRDWRILLPMGLMTKNGSWSFQAWAMADLTGITPDPAIRWRYVSNGLASDKPIRPELFDSSTPEGVVWRLSLIAEKPGTKADAVRHLFADGLDQERRGYLINETLARVSRLRKSDKFESRMQSISENPCIYGFQIRPDLVSVQVLFEFGYLEVLVVKEGTNWRVLGPPDLLDLSKLL